MHIAAGHFLATVEAGEFDEDCHTSDFTAELLHQVAAGFHGSTGRKHIIDDQHALAFDDRILVHFQGVLPILQIIGHRHLLMGQLSGLSNHLKACTDCASNGSTKDEAPAFCSNDKIYLLATKRVSEQFDGKSQPPGVGEQGRNISKKNARLRKIGDIANQPFQVGDGVVHGGNCK